MATLTFDQARSCVLQKVATAVGLPIEQVPLLESHGRVLASALAADRDYPPLARSVRDGFAIRSSDIPGSLTIAGEVRAGQASTVALSQGEAIEIMTGAPVPAGADSVVMVEHTVTTGNQVRIDRSIRYGENISPRGSEAKQGQPLLVVGQRIGYTEIALLATCGHALVSVFRRLNVAIVATGDEILDVPE
ncbi:MAG: molybdopterin molybdenumtransferase MoeA, partial [Acidobacteriota bacterium]|nr:molybdopterin molybdenumtransferase MoeA [Acidobacteriota bacterium]